MPPRAHRGKNSQSRRRCDPSHAGLFRAPPFDVFKRTLEKLTLSRAAEVSTDGVFRGAQRIRNNGQPALTKINGNPPGQGSEAAPKLSGRIMLAVDSGFQYKGLEKSAAGRVDVGHQLGGSRADIWVIAPRQTEISRPEFRPRDCFDVHSESVKKSQGILHRHMKTVSVRCFSTGPRHRPSGVA